MVTIKYITLLITLWMGLATASYADWQYTKWGMTPEQVIIASKGLAVHTKDKENISRSASDGAHKVQLTTQYESGKFKFTVYFLFDRNSSELTYVHLLLNDKKFNSELLGATTSKYGKYDGKSLGEYLKIYYWYAAGDQITYTDASSSVTLRYHPRLTKNNVGL